MPYSGLSTAPPCRPRRSSPAAGPVVDRRSRGVSTVTAPDRDQFLPSALRTDSCSSASSSAVAPAGWRIVAAAGYFAASCGTPSPRRPDLRAAWPRSPAAKRPGAPPCSGRRAACAARRQSSCRRRRRRCRSPANRRARGPRGAGRPGAVDLGDERREHRRAGRHLDDLDVGAEARPIAAQFRAHRVAMAWLCSLRWCLSTRLTCRSPTPLLAAQVVLAHEPVEVDRRGGAGVGLESVTRAPSQVGGEFAQQRSAAVVSSGVPAGMSTTTWNSDLLSNGSI